MNLKTCLCVAVALVAGLSLAVAGEVKSGLEPGASIGAFDVVKCAGAASDGIDVGEQLCYRCRYGQKPMVMVFARKADDSLAGLVKELDASVAASSSKKLQAFVNLLGSDREAVEGQAKEFGAQVKAENVPIVVPVESENGPENYGISPDASVTVIVAEKGKVVANHAISGDLDEATVNAILGDVKKLVQ
jgi:hypothetical protein